jgi:hypothetical protein
VNASHPPRLAVWLLKHFGPETNLEALAGDLQEAFTLGKSNAWYWRQVLRAISWRKHLRVLLGSAVLAWVLTEPEWWRNVPFVSHRVDTAMLTAVLLTTEYLPGMLPGKPRAMLAVLVVIFFFGLYLYGHDINYLICGFWLGTSMAFYRKRPESSPHRLNWREWIMRGPEAERERLIASLNLALLRETDPQLRLLYAQVIDHVKSNKTEGLVPPT